jgi:hypothetical protein
VLKAYMLYSGMNYKAVRDSFYLISFCRYHVQYASSQVQTTHVNKVKCNQLVIMSCSYCYTYFCILYCNLSSLRSFCIFYFYILCNKHVLLKLHSFYLIFVQHEEELSNFHSFEVIRTGCQFL